MPFLGKFPTQIVDPEVDINGGAIDGVTIGATTASAATVTTLTSGNITTTGYIAGPATFTIDPAAVGDNTGTLVVAGNLQVDGTTTTINSTTMTVDDLNITLASGAANAAAANGAGITVDGASATITYDSTNDEWDFNKDINVTGTVTADGLTVDGTGNEVISVNSTANGSQINFNSATTSSDWIVGISNDATDDFLIYQAGVGAGDIRLYTDGTERLTVLNGGNVGIGSASNHAGARVVINDTPPTAFGSPMFQVGQETFTASGYYSIGLGFTNGTYTEPPAEIAAVSTSSSGGTTADIIFGTRSVTTNTAVTERMRIDTSGNVGIGTASPSSKTEIQDKVLSTSNRPTYKGTLCISDYGNASSVSGGLEFHSNSGGGAGYGSLIFPLTDGTLGFATRTNSSSWSERMRIDSSGNLLVGKNSTDNTTNGFVLDANGTLNVVRSSEYLMRLNRTTTDGEILRFQKDGTQVGSIQSISGVVSGIVLDPRNVNSGGAGIAGTNGNAIVPMDRLGVSDADIDLGLSSIRWRNLYLSGGAYLGGTGSANHLDDYEEGNWSPTITGSSGASGQSYSHQRGRYRKIGNVVHITFDAELTNAGSISGTYMVLGGLPFSGDGANVGGGIVTTYSSGWSSNLVEPILAYISGSLCYLMEGGSTGNDYILQSNNYHSSSSRLIGWGTVILPA